MKREQLKELGISDEHIDNIMKLHGKSISEIETKTKELQGQLTEANKAIEGFKSLNVDEIKQAAEEWKIKAEKAEKDASERIESLSKESFAKEYAASLKFSSKAAKNQFIKDLLSENLKYKDGAFLGVDDFKTKYAETDPEAFKEAESEQPTGRVDFSAKHDSKVEPDKNEKLNAAFNALVK